MRTVSAAGGVLCMAAFVVAAGRAGGTPQADSAPTINAVAPSVGANDRAQHLTLRGKGFGTSSKAVDVLFGPTGTSFDDEGAIAKCSGVTVVSDEIVECVLPSGLPRMRSVHFVVVVRGASKTAVSDVSTAAYMPLSPAHATHARAPQKELTACGIHLVGTDIAGVSGAPTVTFRGPPVRSCDDVWTVGSAEIICHIAVGADGCCDAFDDASKFDIVRAGE